MSGVVQLVALCIPFFTYAGAVCFFGVEVVILSVFGACAFSASAFIFWLNSNYLANKYLRERDRRDKTRLRDAMQKLTTENTQGEQDRVQHEEGDGGNRSAAAAEKTLPGPRTVTRLSPVLPAFLSLLSIVCIIANILVAASVSIYEILTEEAEGKPE